MSRHWKPPGKWAVIDGYVPARRRGGGKLSRTTVGVVLVAAACFGIAVGLGKVPVIASPDAGSPRGSAAPNDAVRAAFGYCYSGGGTNCVVDGDTFWIGGDKVRIAGIHAPETHPSHCDYEAKLGEEATGIVSVYSRQRCRNYSVHCLPEPVLFERTAGSIRYYLPDFMELLLYNVIHAWCGTGVPLAALESRRRYGNFYEFLAAV